MPLRLKPHQDEFCQERITRAFSSGAPDWNALSVGLFSDMGTGKSPATILLLERARAMLKATHRPESEWPCLIICPAAVKYNWENEFHRFSPWVKRIMVVGGMRKEREKQLETFHDMEYVITNYETIRIHQQWFQKLTNLLAIVVDEAHAIKNREAKRTVAIKSVNALFRMALTGTPITNRPDDLWSILHFLYPGAEVFRTYQREPELISIRYRGASPLWGSYWSFASKWCEWESNSFGNRIVGGKNLDALHRKLTASRSMVRWRRAEVLDLEPIIYRYVLLEPTTEQKALYRQLADGYATYLEGQTLSRKVIQGLLAQLTYFRRATTLTPREFALALAGKPRFAPDLQVPVSDRGAKQEWLLEFIENYLDSEKMLIFSDWTACTRTVTERLRKHGIEVVSVDGSTPHQERFEIQEAFNKEGGPQVFVGSPAAYEGLNLQAASYVVFMNLPWRPKDVFQAYSRCHRFGQERQVTVVFPTLRGTIDGKMAETLRTKQGDIDKAIDNGEIDGARLFEITSKDEILDMLGDSASFRWRNLDK